MGYKCDRCRDNFFLTAGGAQCQECPSCYALVKEEVSPPRPGPVQAPSRPAAPLIHSVASVSTSSVLGTRNRPPTHSSLAFQDHRCLLPVRAQRRAAPRPP